MGLREEEERLFEGPAVRLRPPGPGRPLDTALFLAAVTVVLAELVIVSAQLLRHGLVDPDTARAFAAVGVACLVVANVKSVALSLSHHATEALGALLALAMPRLWALHFWLNPLGLFSLGLFLAFAPRLQPPAYLVAYGVLLWQGASGLLAREPFRLRGAGPAVGRAARAGHHQPAVFVVLTVLAAAGFVDSLFP